ncbi:hypothetical protein [Sphingobium baderi]|nr:hypothetical protein [Sphingobium baderi]
MGFGLRIIQVPSQKDRDLRAQRLDHQRGFEIRSDQLISEADPGRLWRRTAALENRPSTYACHDCGWATQGESEQMARALSSFITMEGGRLGITFEDDVLEREGRWFRRREFFEDPEDSLLKDHVRLRGRLPSANHSEREYA